MKRKVSVCVANSPRLPSDVDADRKQKVSDPLNLVLKVAYFSRRGVVDLHLDVRPGDETCIGGRSPLTPMAAASADPDAIDVRANVSAPRWILPGLTRATCGTTGNACCRISGSRPAGNRAILKTGERGFSGQ